MVVGVRLGGMEVGVTEVFFLFLQPRGKSFTAWAASHFAFKHARPVSLSVTLSRELDAGPMGFGFAAR